MKKISSIVILSLVLHSCSQTEITDQVIQKEHFLSSIDYNQMYLDVIQIPPKEPKVNLEIAKIVGSFTPIEDVSGNYTTETKLLDISNISCETWVSSVSDGFLKLDFISDYTYNMFKVQAGICGWGRSWGAPPGVEGPNPHLLYSYGQNSIPISLSSPVKTFGFELQPQNAYFRDPTAPSIISVAFYRNGYLINTITKGINREESAKLFAAQTDASFDYVLISMSDGNGFTIGQFRYELAEEKNPFIVDVKPESCDNPININSKGVFPVSIIGSIDLNVKDIVPSTIRMNGVVPEKTSISDIGGFYDKESFCDCDPKELDGIMDLDIKFNTQEIVPTLGEVSDGNKATVSITFETTDGKKWTGNDCILIIKKGKKK